MIYRKMSAKCIWKKESCNKALVVDKVRVNFARKVSNIKKTLNTITEYNIKFKDRNYSKLYSSKENYIIE